MRLQRRQAAALATAIRHLQSLSHAVVSQKLADFQGNHTRPAAPAMRMRQSGDLLNSCDPMFWVYCFFTDLFRRADCCEQYAAHRGKQQASGRIWSKCLLKRADYIGWRSNREFLACMYNVFLRRDQIQAVRLYTSQVRARDRVGAFQSLNV